MMIKSIQGVISYENHSFAVKGFFLYTLSNMVSVVDNVKDIDDVKGSFKKVKDLGNIPPVPQLHNTLTDLPKDGESQISSVLEDYSKDLQGLLDSIESLKTDLTKAKKIIKK